MKFTTLSITLMFLLFSSLVAAEVQDDARACTMEAKICPDGSAVGRTGPNCEFAPCPETIIGCAQDAKICPDGRAVGRVAPGCEFAPCSEVICTADAKICPDGTAVGRIPPTCEFSPCPDVRICTTEYAPVCGQPPMPPCPEGIGCAQVMPKPQTYSNRCMLETAGATFLYDGKCDAPTCGNNICEEGEATHCPVYDCKEGEPCPAAPCYQGTCPKDCEKPSCPENCVCDQDGNTIECKVFPCPENCVCDYEGNAISCKIPTCPENCACDEGGRIIDCEEPRDYICWDSDGGKNYDVRGEVVVKRDGGKQFYEDKCAYGQQGNPDTMRDKNLLFEAHCFDGGYGYDYHYCKNGCNDGACAPETYVCPVNCNCDKYGRVIACNKPVPVCGNGICERGEGQACDKIAVTCKIGQPCEVPDDTTCYTSCPEDCDKPTGTYAKLNEKFKLRVGQPVKITDYDDMKITFLDISEYECGEREVYTTNAITGNVVDETYGVKMSDVDVWEEEMRPVELKKQQITKCRDGGIIAKLQITHEEYPTKYVTINLGEKKEIFGVTLSFLDYYSQHRTGVFLVSRGVTDCPERCICSADGTMDCPIDECVDGTILCPDGRCREECDSVTIEDCSFGCLYGESCLPIGTRVKGQYCDIGRDLEEQQDSEAVCENNFECQSNLCVDSQCVEPGVFKAIMRWFDRLF